MATLRLQGEGGYHPRKQTSNPRHPSVDFYHSPVAVWVNSAPQPKRWGPRAHRGTANERTQYKSNTICYWLRLCSAIDRNRTLKNTTGCSECNKHKVNVYIYPKQSETDKNNLQNYSTLIKKRKKIPPRKCSMFTWPQNTAVLTWQRANPKQTVLWADHVNFTWGQ